jgi:hypothetical protein
LGALCVTGSTVTTLALSAARTVARTMTQGLSSRALVQRGLMFGVPEMGMGNDRGRLRIRNGHFAGLCRIEQSVEVGMPLVHAGLAGCLDLLVGKLGGRKAAAAFLESPVSPTIRVHGTLSYEASSHCQRFPCKGFPSGANQDRVFVHSHGGPHMRVKVRTIGEGLHPNEVVVELTTLNGVERLVVDRRSVEAKSISVGAPLRRDEGRQLVELPRETMSGLWRVWIKPELLSPDIVVNAA